MLLAQPFRAWLEVSDCSVPVCAHYQEIQLLANDQIELSFNRTASSAELDAVLMGRLFTLTSREDVATLEAKPNARVGQFQDRLGGKGYAIHNQIPETTPTAKVFACLDDAQARVAVVSKITGDRQICIYEGGKFIVSADLVNIPLLARIPVTYPQIVMMSEDPIEMLTMHLVGKASNQTVQYICLKECRLVPLPRNERKDRTIRLAYDPNTIHRATLNASKVLDTSNSSET